ncbi:conserved hypothetical protein [Xylella fastidiosa M12]|nr:conserved hypothetical protein [Xylella fastidiosa M12]
MVTADVLFSFVNESGYFSEQGTAKHILFSNEETC